MDISIIIPYKENRGYLNEAIHSAENQDFKGTYEVIKVHSDLSLSKNVNIGLKKAKGKYIKLLHDDDMLTEDCLSTLFNAIGDYDWICADAINFEIGNDNQYFKSELPKTIHELCMYNSIHGGTVMYKKDVLLTLGGFDAELWTGEEYELHLRLLDNYHKPTYVNKVVYWYRIHQYQKSIGKDINKGERLKNRFDEIMKIKKRYESSSNAKRFIRY